MGAAALRVGPRRPGHAAGRVRSPRRSRFRAWAPRLPRPLPTRGLPSLTAFLQSEGPGITAAAKALLGPPRWTQLLRQHLLHVLVLLQLHLHLLHRPCPRPGRGLLVRHLRLVPLVFLLLFLLVRITLRPVLRPLQLHGWGVRSRVKGGHLLWTLASPWPATQPGQC